MSRPQLWVIAGPSGAGKSLLTKTVQKHFGEHGLTIVNPDDVASRRLDSLEGNQFPADFERVAIDHANLAHLWNKGNCYQQCPEYDPFDTLSDMNHYEPI